MPISEYPCKSEWNIVPKIKSLDLESRNEDSRNQPPPSSGRCHPQTPPREERLDLVTPPVDRKLMKGRY
jgi:hypothetical protein